MARIVEGLTARRVAANLATVEREIELACERTGRDPQAVSIVAAVKYVAADEIHVLRDAGIGVAGENRAQDLVRKSGLVPELEWHFIGHIQSRKVRQIVPHVSLIHAVCTDSVVEQLAKHAPPGTKVLIEVNVSAEEGKSGISPAELPDFIERCRSVAGTDVRGLMTMPPLAERPEDSRQWFATLAELASEHELPELSMGTTQDYAVAVEEGATLVRVGSCLYA
jgi:pyridoxal phosphate enzyme (YggS family)